jgi:LCP family protein required for cell wall assembly
MGERNGRRRRRATRLHPMRLAFLTLVSLIVSGLGGAAAYFYPVLAAGLGQTGQKVTVPTPSASVSATAAPTHVVNPGTAFTVLLLGSDDDAKFTGGSADAAAQAHGILTQSMILVRVDPVTKHVVLLSIPRDFWISMACGQTAGKADWAYSFGGPSCAIATVQRDFGVHIDEYAWIGLKGLIKLIDLFGGVDVNVTNPVLDDIYPNDINVSYIWGYTRIAVLPGPQHLDGTHALQYVRSRHNDINGDFGRSARQQQVLVALKAKASTLNAADLPDLVNALSGEFKTSMGLDRVRALLGVANAFSPQNITSIVLYAGTYCEYGHVGSQSVLFPVWSAILPVVRQYFP